MDKKLRQDRSQQDVFASSATDCEGTLFFFFLFKVQMYLPLLYSPNFSQNIAMPLLTRIRMTLLLRGLILLHFLVDIVCAYIFSEIFVEPAQGKNMRLLPFFLDYRKNEKKRIIRANWQLTYHSPLHFNFTQLCQNVVVKGWINILSLNRVTIVFTCMYLLSGILHPFVSYSSKTVLARLALYVWPAELILRVVYVGYRISIATSDVSTFDSFQSIQPMMFGFVRFCGGWVWVETIPDETRAGDENAAESEGNHPGS